ncbi:LuxR family transcriptional regulator [Sphingomonas sp. TDK1]|nr:LuxR family transcriptional regulator [Sphingomonas sp. TDK1]
MLDLRLLRAFVAIVDCGGFTAAGARLHATQSTVSQQLARLEQALGRTLVDRASRPVLPTPGGERLLAHARRLLALHDEAEKLLADPAGTAAIRIGLPDDLVTSALSLEIANFVAHHREVRVDMTTGLSRNLLRRYRDGEFDIALVKEPVAAADARASFVEPLAWFQARHHVGDWPAPLPLVAFPPGGLYRDRMIERIQQRGCGWYIAFTGTSLGSVLSAVEAGLGVSILPISATRQHALVRAPQFPEETPLVVSLYAWEADGPVGALAARVRAVVSQRSG